MNLDINNLMLIFVLSDQCENNLRKLPINKDPGISFDTVLKNVGEAFAKNRDKASIVR